jgi:hypothetical protein
MEQLKPNCLYAQKTNLAKKNNLAYFRECFIKKHEKIKKKKRYLSLSAYWWNKKYAIYLKICFSTDFCLKKKVEKYHRQLTPNYNIDHTTVE